MILRQRDRRGTVTYLIWNLEEKNQLTITRAQQLPSSHQPDNQINPAH